MKKKNCLIYCNCGADIISTEKKDALNDIVKKSKTDVIELQDLCAFSLNEKDYLNSIEDRYDKKIIIACYPRAIKSIFAQNKIEITNFEVINFRVSEVETIEKTINSKIIDSNEENSYKIAKSSLEVPAWYPVIEESRCTLCGQCARFCLFGVYKFDKKSLVVTNPLNCKNNCPACGRNCPTDAIIFPRLKENSALSGAEPINTGQSKNEQNGGLFVQLNARNRNRKNIFNPEVMKQAEEERKKALDELKNGLKKI